MRRYLAIWAGKVFKNLHFGVWMGRIGGVGKEKGGICMHFEGCVSFGTCIWTLRISDEWVEMTWQDLILYNGRPEQCCRLSEMQSFLLRGRLA